MVRAIAMFVAVLLLLAASVVPVLSVTPDWEWKRPGTCRFDGTREDVVTIIKKFGLSKPAEEKFIADFLASTLPLANVIQEMKQAGASAEALAAIEKQAGGRKFFTKGELQKLTGVPAAAMETLAKKVSDTAAKPFKIKKGYKFQKMFNCKGDVRERGIYNPDSGQPEQLEAIAFEYTEAGVTNRFVMAGICDNFTYERTEIGLVKHFEAPQAVALRATAAPMAQPGLKNIVMWHWMPHELTNQLGLSHVSRKTWGKNSRSLGASFFVDGNSQPIPPRYTAGDITDEFVFRVVDYVAARGRTVLVNGTQVLIPADFSPEKPGLSVPVTKKGTATLSLGPDWKEWITAQSVLEGSFESFRERVSYPNPEATTGKRAVLATCAKGASELARCGRPWTDDASELYRWLQKGDNDTFRIHMRMK